eukprot:2382651-Prymnesium_polylepis.1
MRQASRQGTYRSTNEPWAAAVLLLMPAGCSSGPTELYRSVHRSASPEKRCRVMRARVRCRR